MPRDYRAYFRDILIHAYFGIDEEEVWSIVDTQLYTFRELVSSKIRMINPELKQEILEAMIDENSYLDFVVKELEFLKGKNGHN